jgi:O-antigen ligase
VPKRILQLGAITTVLAVATLHVFELDRFFVPKELVLHLTALLGGLAAFRAIATSGTTRIDRWLIAYLLLTIFSALFATNPWLAIRATAISVSGILIFRIARTIGPSLLGGLAFAVVLSSITSLLQTYGVNLVLFAENRAPGGTLGNRNFVAHIAAFGLPLVFLAALRARSRGAFFLAAIGASLVTASLVLTRSRAAWLAFAAMLVVFLTAIVITPLLRRDRRIWTRLAGIAIVAASGVAAALLIPNTLRWRSDSPYLETVQRVADYQGGSGRGRLVQYSQSLRMALRHPLLGVGPGNWAVVYPEHAVRNDPSMSDTDGGMTTNPWPSSDWIAIISERGIVAAALLAMAFFTIAIGGAKQLARAVEVEEALLAATLLGTLVGAGVTGLFDAVLLLALPTLLIWAAIGALYVPPSATPARGSVVIAVVMILLSAIGVARSTAQLTAMQIYATRSDRASLTRAAQIDPGNYRLQLRLARLGKRQQRCQHALAALALFPRSDAARAASRGCHD